jgi:hypothetical protein
VVGNARVGILWRPEDAYVYLCPYQKFGTC